MRTGLYKLPDGKHLYLIVFILIFGLFHNNANAACGSTSVSSSSPQIAVNTGASQTWVKNVLLVFFRTEFVDYSGTYLPTLRVPNCPPNKYGCGFINQ